MTVQRVDALIIGAGFYGLSLGLHLHHRYGMNRVVIIDQAEKIMTRASYANQARVHNGYHYPRSVLTGYRSAVSYARFTQEFREAVADSHDMYYGVAKTLSKVTARQFEAFCRKIGSFYHDADPAMAHEMNPGLIEKLWQVTEEVFDTTVLARIRLAQIEETLGAVDICLGVEADRVEPHGNSVLVYTSEDDYEADIVLNCTYSGINDINARSGLALASFKHEITEMAVVRLPQRFNNVGVTIMDGPFFSIMPFPSRGIHTLSHVRYTPHGSWPDTPAEHTRVSPYDKLDRHSAESGFRRMKADVVRYFPAMKDMEYVDSLWEVKTVLMRSEDDDSRPILFARDAQLPGYFSIMGGKIDNIYDAQEELDAALGDLAKTRGVVIS